MKSALLLSGLLLAFALCGWSVLSHWGAVAKGEQELAALTNRAAAAEDDIERVRERLQTVEADTARRLEQIATLSIERRLTQRSPSAEVIRERHTRARDLAERGRWQEALADYLWCYDDAFLRSPGLIKNVAQLAKIYPPAAAELQVRMQYAEARARHDPTDTDALQDFTALDLALNQGARSFAFHDELAVTDERRLRIARALAPEFIARQRYADVSAVVPKYEPTINDLKARLNQQGAARPANQPTPRNEQQRIAAQRARTAQLKASIDSAIVAMEVLAGLGDSNRARSLAEKILLLDPSPENRAAVTARLERAGMTKSDLPPLNPTSP